MFKAACAERFDNRDNQGRQNKSKRQYGQQKLPDRHAGCADDSQFLRLAHAQQAKHGAEQKDERQEINQQQGQAQHGEVKRITGPEVKPIGQAQHLQKIAENGNRPKSRAGNADPNGEAADQIAV